MTITTSLTATGAAGVTRGTTTSIAVPKTGTAHAAVTITAMSIVTNAMANAAAAVMEEATTDNRVW